MTATARTITVDGVTRRYLLAEPPGPASSVVLGLHGTRSSASDQARWSRLDGLASSAGAVVVFPQAVRPIGSGYEWDHEADLPFLRELTVELLERYQPPSRRVALTGMSGGARMSCLLAARQPELTGMVGAVAGLRAPGVEQLAAPVPVLAFHGTADRVNPYDGGPTARWRESVPEAARAWARANGVTAEPTEVAVSATLARRTYGRDGSAEEVTLWTARGAGHTWPGFHLGLVLRVFLGRTNTEIDATAEIASFVARHASR
jgi:polyhydroxybutyrate depolymerase